MNRLRFLKSDLYGIRMEINLYPTSKLLNINTIKNFNMIIVHKYCKKRV
jgi:hypothetical protein